MSEDNQPCRQEWGSIALCILLSLLLHAGLAWALDLLPRNQNGQARQPAPRNVRHVQVLRAVAREKKPQAQPAPDPPRRPFAKTSADMAEKRPAHADFIGSRDSVASGEAEAPPRESEAPLPTMAGRESEDEVVTFDQERQDGDLAHERKPAATPPSPPAAATPPLPSQPPQAVAKGDPEGHPEDGHPEGEGKEAPQPAAATTAATQPTPSSGEEGIKLGELSTQDALTLARELPPPAPLGHPEGKEGQASATQPARPQRRAVYDPALAADAQQPGLRTYERRSRSTGRFVFGSRPALNVAATERGRYEAEIYRRIARVWYAACDDHRGDIIPGSITVSLRLTRRGSIDSMDLVRRRGASIIQQSFSFGAIRRAALPPMPQEVQQELIGQLYEMILTFNFD